MSLYNRIHQSGGDEIKQINFGEQSLRQNSPEDSFKTIKFKKKSLESDKIETSIRRKSIDEIMRMSIRDFENDESIKKIKKIIDDKIEEEFEEKRHNITINEKKKILENILESITGFGPITQLIEDDSISEVMINGYEKIYIEQNGKLLLTKLKFRSEESLYNIIDRIVGKVGRRVDESSPMVDARLPDGSRVNIIIPPLAINGPTVTIRKFSRNPYTVEDLIDFGTITPWVGRFLMCCVGAKFNILVSGGTGSGKTSTLGVISAFIPKDERIVTIEDAAELRLWQDHVVTLEARPKNSEGVGEVSIRDLVKNALRMRPDRIVIGEVRSGEALDMLQAMNTGHEGSLSTGHANSPRDMISRLETMVLMAGIELPLKAIREQISSAIDLIVHQERLRDGSRRVVSITEVIGMENDTIVLQEIFKFEYTGENENGRIIGELVPTGILPSKYNKFSECGIEIPKNMFINYMK